MPFISIVIRSVCIIFLSVLPGFSLTKFLPYTREEKFVLSFAFSFILYYIVGFLWYISGFDVKFLPIFIALILIVSLLTIIRKKMIDASFFQLFFIFSFFYFVLIFIQSLIPYYGGGMWYFDWWEHFARSIFFLNRLPLSTAFGPFLITSRPPFFNLITAVFMSVIGHSFSSYQIIATLLNSFMVLPVFLLIKRHFSLKSSQFILCLLTIFMLLNPSIMTQIIYPWTKGFSSAFFVLGLFFYLNWKKTRENLRFILSVLFFASAILIHYSSIIYIFLIGIDFFIIAIKQRRIQVAPIILSIILTALLLSSWVVWSISNFGLEKSFLEDAHISWQKKLTPREWSNKNLNNLYYTFVPVISDRFRSFISYQPSTFSLQSDILFIFHATTLVGSLTIPGTVILFIYLITQSLTFIQRGKFLKYMFSFLPLFVFFALLLAPIAEPVNSPTGVAHTVYVALLLIVLSVIVTQLMKIVYQKNILAIIWILFILLEGIVSTGVWIMNLRSNYELVRSGKPISLYHADNIQLKERDHLTFLFDEINNR